MESEDVQTQPKPQSINALEPKMCLQGVVTDTQLYGALVDIGLEYTGLVHISQLAPTRVNRVTDVVQPGDSVTVWVTNVDVENKRIALTMVEPAEKDWKELAAGQTHTGIVTRVENYGAFVDIGAERPGLLHVREMAAGYVQHPSEVVKVGDEIDVRILEIDRRKRRIDLTLMGADEVEEGDEEAPMLTAMEIALQRAQTESPEQPHRDRDARQDRPDLSEREDILARTLRLHSQSQQQSK
ncbi:MAG: 30S ribosomal protein S1 [Anaerolineae bacterium]|nr:30S ribosomal protein S1 [Anaerolineae bacterium]